MESILEAKSRDSFGKNEARSTRREGKVPAVVYGAPSEAGEMRRRRLRSIRRRC